MWYERRESKPPPEPRSKGSHIPETAVRIGATVLTAAGTAFGSPASFTRVAYGEGIPQDRAHTLTVPVQDLTIPTTFPLNPAEEVATEAEETGVKAEDTAVLNAGIEAPGEITTGGELQLPTERPLTAAEQLIVDNTELIGSKSYDLGNKSITVEVRAGQGSPVYFGLQGDPTTIPGVPDQLSAEAANMFITTGEFSNVTHVTLVTLRPGDPLFDRLQINKTFAPIAFNPAAGAPQMPITDAGGELTGDGNLTFVVRPVKWEPDNQTRITGLKGATVSALAGALINGGQNGFLPIELTSGQNRTIVNVRPVAGNIVQVVS
ncbi:hypothetical protein HYW41_01385 [Candidatus Daviesbacteria bacterium]|nr:hypothetical protein [Candidatus Daviesbacteria bacterium]